MTEDEMMRVFGFVVPKSPPEMDVPDDYWPDVQITVIAAHPDGSPVKLGFKYSHSEAGRPLSDHVLDVLKDLRRSTWHAIHNNSGPVA